MKIYSQFDGNMVGFRDIRNLDIKIVKVEWGWSDSSGWGLYVTIADEHDASNVSEHRLKVRRGRDGEYIRYRRSSKGIDWKLRASDFIMV